jgi:hypothetical protein
LIIPLLLTEKDENGRYCGQNEALSLSLSIITVKTTKMSVESISQPNLKHTPLEPKSEMLHIYILRILCKLSIKKRSLVHVILQSKIDFNKILNLMYVAAYF